MSEPPVIMKTFTCPICSKKSQLWEGVISRLEDAAQQARKIKEFDVEVDYRQECDNCFPVWMHDMGLKESDELEEWQKELGMKVYRMEKDENDFRDSKEDHLRGRGFYITIIVSHPALPEPERLFLDTNDATLLFRLLQGKEDSELSMKRQYDVEHTKLEKWYLNLKNRLASDIRHSEHTIEPKELDFGDLKHGKPVVKHFKLINPENRPVGFSFHGVLAASDAEVEKEPGFKFPYKLVYRFGFTADDMNEDWYANPVKRRFVVAPKSEVSIPIIAQWSEDAMSSNNEITVSTYYADEESVEFQKRISVWLFHADEPK